MSKNICILVGHGKSASGGYDSGAVSGGYHEFRIAREIARHAADYLGCDLMNYNGDLYLTDRIKKVNKSNYDFIAEIHLNAAGGTGTEVYYYHDSPTGLKASTEICKNISEALSVGNRGPKVRLGKNGKDYFAVIRQTKPCAVLVETVFIDNPNDLNKIKTAEGQKKCGVAIGKAIKKALAVQKNGFDVTVICRSLYIRKGAGTKYRTNGTVKKNDVLSITETDSASSWGKLADGRGWISLNGKYIRRF